MANQPEKRFKCGAVEGAVFENEIEKNGAKVKLNILEFKRIVVVRKIPLIS